MVPKGVPPAKRSTRISTYFDIRVPAINCSKKMNEQDFRFKTSLFYIGVGMYF